VGTSAIINDRNLYPYLKDVEADSAMTDEGARKRGISHHPTTLVTVDGEP
jgi:hypothetical protein